MANWAIAIGINEYSDFSLRNLRYAKRDAEQIRDYFLQAGFDRVCYFSDDSPPWEAPNGFIQDTRPTYANLRSFLYDFFEDDENPWLDPGDNFWFFFSGHGLRDRERDYILPYDGNPRQPEFTAIPVSYITERLRRSGADNIILLLDACRNETGERSSGTFGLEKHQGVITFASCSPKQKSYEIEQIQQGSFTYALLESLHIRGENNCATVERLYQRLRYRVSEINTQYGKPQQTPYAIAEPASKYHLILLESQATERDIAQLVQEAQDAELERDYQLAEQLWIRVLAVSPANPRAIRAIKRLAREPQFEVEEKTEEIIEAQGKSVIQSISSSEPNKSSTELVSLNLLSASFESATISIRRGGLFGLGKTIEIHRQQHKAQYFVEDLGHGVSLEMMLIPAGEFLMGAPEDESRGLDGERPQHQVMVPQFFMGRYAVTQEQWRVVATLPKIDRDLEPDPSYFKGDRRPVERVSWYDVVEFCQRLSQATGREYKLPSEAEWEYACRAGTTTPFHFGETITTDLANYNSNSTLAEEAKGPYRKQTIEVGSLSVANRFGLYDMHGNVLEWCADDSQDNYDGAPTDGKAWIDDRTKNMKLEDENRILKKRSRGGSWEFMAWSCRSACYYDPPPDIGGPHQGFRVCCSAARAEIN